jgi:outer membrane protein
MNRTVVIVLLLATRLSAFAEQTKHTRLNLPDARARAIANHPRISAAELKALATQSVVSQARAPFFPFVNANFTAVESLTENTRIAAGGMNNPVIFDRVAVGIAINQLVTDFGRTFHQLAGSKLRSRAEAEASRGARNLLLLQVSTNFYTVLQQQEIVRVARKTVATRKAVLEQVSGLALNQLRSELDVSFASVNYQDAELLLTKSENDLKSAQLGMVAMLGLRDDWNYELVEEPGSPEEIAPIETMISCAFDHRPELARLRLEVDAARHTANAEKALSMPTVTAFASVGNIPVRDERLPQNYAAAGVNVSVPVFAGGLNSARRAEAEIKVRVTESHLRDEENQIIRDLKITYHNVTFSKKKLALQEDLLKHAQNSASLAQSRYELGSSSIVELGQAQLNQTAAEIAFAVSRYDYLLQRAILDFHRGEP